jgi:ComEC/Rec2-related protein
MNKRKILDLLSSPLCLLVLLLLPSLLFFLPSPLWLGYQLIFQVSVLLLAIFIPSWRLIAVLYGVLLLVSEIDTVVKLDAPIPTCVDNLYSLKGQVQQSSFEDKKKLYLTDVEVSCLQRSGKLAFAQVELNTDMRKGWFLPGDLILLKKVNFSHSERFVNIFTTQKKSRVINLTKQAKTFNRSSLLLYIQNKGRYYLHKMPNVLYRSLITADKTLLEKDWKKSIVNLGIAHLFAISGLHVGIIYLWLSLILRFLLITPGQSSERGYRLFIVELVIVCLLTAFLKLIGMPVSALRALLMLSWWLAMRYFLPNQSNWFIVTGVAVLVLLDNPYAVGRLSFQLSFVSVTGILLIMPLFPFPRKRDNLYQKFKNILVISFLISTWLTILTLPIIQEITSEHTVLSPFFNLIHILYVSWVFLPISLIILGATILSYPFWGFMGEFYLYSLLNFTGNLWNYLLVKSIEVNSWGLFEFNFKWGVTSTIIYWSSLVLANRLIIKLWLARHDTEP